MSIVSRLFPRDEKTGAGPKPSPAKDWIDLSDYQTKEKTGDGVGGAHTLIRFAEIRALDDLKHFATYVYDGNILILDFSKVQSDEILLRRLTNELRKLATDTNGDLAGLGDHHILLTPTGIKVDHNKLTSKPSGEDEEPSIPRTSASPAPLAGPGASPSALPSPPATPSGAPGRRMNGGRRS